MGVHGFSLKYVSVPLRGKYCRELDISKSDKLNWALKFPSPCGVNIVGNLSHTSS